MEIRHSKDTENIELPLKLNISFEKVFCLFEKYAGNDFIKHPFHTSAKRMITELGRFPELRNGFSDLSLLEKHNNIISLLLEPLFPELLSENEIKAVTVPFSFTSFKFTNRFKNILKNAGENYELKIRNFEDDHMYIEACTLILNFVYKHPVDLKRPFYFDIPDYKTQTTNNYRVAFNADFMEIIPTEHAPKLTNEDIKILLNNFNNIDIWKEKFPPNAYILKGFGLMSLFDVTADEVISEIRANLLRRDDNLIDILQENCRKFYGINDLLVGLSVFDVTQKELANTRIKKEDSLVVSFKENIICTGIFCNHILDKIFVKQEAVAISNVQKYGEETNKNEFYQRLKKQGIGSIILIPVKASTKDDLAIIEIASPRAFELNSINQKLILPPYL